MSKQQIILQDAYDQLMYQTVRDASPVVEELAGEKGKMDPLLSDVFSSFYKTNPTIDEQAPDSAHKSSIESMMNLTEFKNMRPMTRLDDVASALALAQFAPDMVEALAQKEKDQKDGKDPGETEANFRSGIRESLKQAGEKVEDWADFANTFGDQAGELKRLPHEEKMKLANNLSSSKKMKDISKLLGRLKNIALGAAAQSPVNGYEEIVDVTQGADITRMLPTEIIKYSKMRTLFYKDMLEQSLSVYNLKGVQNMGMGPIVACLDISGSMQGEREIWSKAVILALAFLAEKQNRHFAVVTFAERVKDVIVYKNGKLTVHDKIHLVSIHMNGGGTNFYHPLKGAFRVIEEFAVMKTADVLMVTDGECALQGVELKDVLNNKSKVDARTYGIGVGSECRESSLEGFCDNVSMVSDLGEINHCKNILTKTSMNSIGKKHG